MPFGLPVVPLVYSRKSSCSRVHRLGRAHRVGRSDQVVVPVVATLLHLDLVAAATHDDDVLDRRRRRDRLVGGGLQREHVAAAIATVGRDQHLGLGVVDAVRQRLCAEAAEDDTVCRADASTGQHGDGCLGHHRQVDVDAVAALYAEPLQRVGEPLHLVEQIGVGQDASIARLTLPIERHLVATPGLDVAVEAVVADVELAAEEPLGIRQLPFADGAPVGAPRHQIGRLAGPERFVVLVGLVVQRRVDDQRLTLELVGWGELAVLQHQVVDGVVVVAHVVTP